MEKGGWGAGTAAGHLQARQHSTQLSLRAALQEAQQIQRASYLQFACTLHLAASRESESKVCAFICTYVYACMAHASLTCAYGKLLLYTIRGMGHSELSHRG